MPSIPNTDSIKGTDSQPLSGAQQQDKGQWEKLGHRKFCTNTRKNFFTVRVTEHWNRLPRDVEESPPMEIFKICLDTYLCDVLY